MLDHIPMLSISGLKGQIKRDAIIYVKDSLEFIWNHNTFCSQFLFIRIIIVVFYMVLYYIFQCQDIPMVLLFIYYCLYVLLKSLVAGEYHLYSYIMFYAVMFFMLSYHIAIAYSIPSVYECKSYIPMTWSLSLSLSLLL